MWLNPSFLPVLMTPLQAYSIPDSILDLEQAIQKALNDYDSTVAGIF